MKPIHNMLLIFETFLKTFHQCCLMSFSYTLTRFSFSCYCHLIQNKSNNPKLRTENITMIVKGHSKMNKVFASIFVYSLKSTHNILLILKILKNTFLQCCLVSFSYALTRFSFCCFSYLIRNDALN